MQTTLFLMLGYPGAGKTTTAQAISRIMGATHLWADHIRRHIFGNPTYNHQENLSLYKQMNRNAEDLLSSGNSVIFDTNFSYYKDRQMLQKLAAKHSARTVIVWVQVTKEVARMRATKDAHLQDTRVLGNMSENDFERLSSHLELPHGDEVVIDIDGTKVTDEYVRNRLNVLS